MPMTNVTLAIGGRALTISVAAGEEAHIEMLGRMIDDRLRRMGNHITNSEARMLLFAALMLADELHDSHSRPPVAAAAVPPELVARMASLAERVENLALKLGEPLEPDAATS